MTDDDYLEELMQAKMEMAEIRFQMSEYWIFRSKFGDDKK